jgi:predicted SAM-dependent methyltransferase
MLQNLKDFIKTRLTIRKVKNLEKKDEPVKLEIGAGPKKGENGWTTLDVCGGVDLFWDLQKKMPFNDNSVQEVYSCHVLEHFWYKDLMILLKDIYRILKPGGKISVVVPNARLFVEGYAHPEKFNKALLKYEPGIISEKKMDILNYLFYMDNQHRYMFDEENLEFVLQIKE